MLPGVYNNNVQIVQTRDYVAIVSEMIHDARIVPMDGRPHGAVPRWMGDSRGRWEGSTLVVDTIGFTDKTAFRGSTERLHLVERFTRVDADTIEYRFTAEDPSTWTPAVHRHVPDEEDGGPDLRIRLPRGERAQHDRDAQGRACAGAARTSRSASC